MHDYGDCKTCDGRGLRTEPASAEDCYCDQCTTGYWVWPKEVGTGNAAHYETLTAALRANDGEVTKRELRGSHWVHERVAMIG